MKWLTKIKYESEFKLRLTFNDGKSFKVDFKDLLDGQVYLPLKNVEEFKKFYIHPDFDILSWPNGADFSSDFLYEIGQKQSKRSA
jgi:hypothetical protein